MINGSSPSEQQPIINGDLHSESTQHIKLESETTDHSTSGKKAMNENWTDDEKTGSIQISTKNGPYTTNSEAETTRYSAGEITTKSILEGSLNGSRIPVEETVHVVAAPTAQSAAAIRMEGLFLNLEGDEGSLRSEARYNFLSVCLSVTQSISVSLSVCSSVSLCFCLSVSGCL